MKILYVTTVGITMGFFKSLIRELLNRGDTVDIAANELNGESIIPACYREWGCKVYPISCSRSPLNKRNIAAVGEIKRIVSDGNYDIVHCHTPVAATCTRIACKELRKSGVKVIYTAHGFHFYKGAPIKNWLLYYPIEWLCAHWTDVLITINREDFEIAKKHMHAKRVKYVPGVGIDVKKFTGIQVDRTAKHREIGVPKDAIILLSVGELNENKNHAVIIKALAKLNDKNIHYVIAGTGNQKDELERLASSLGISNNVHLLGYRSDVFELYSIADVFAFPSIREGLPVAAMEAMAAGVPIVAANNRGTRDIFENGKSAIICNHDDVDGFVSAIQEMISNHEKRRTYATANMLAVRRYDMTTIQPEMRDIYTGVFTDCSCRERERERERERASKGGATYPDCKGTTN